MTLPHTIQQLREEFEEKLSHYVSDTSVKKKDLIEYFTHSHLALLTALLEEVGQDEKWEANCGYDDEEEKGFQKGIAAQIKLNNQERSRLRSIIQSTIDSLKETT